VKEEASAPSPAAQDAFERPRETHQHHAVHEKHLDETRAYYDEFSHSYEQHRRPHRQDGYHALVDDLEVELCARYATGKDILECGCGTGLILERLVPFARRAAGIDLSPGMLARARSRGLEVREGSVTHLPFDDATFDVTCSFKVLAHVKEIARALAEMARVTRPGGVILAELYNPWSLRGLAKRFGPAGLISHRGTRESAVYTRYDAPSVVPRILPPGTHVEAARGVRIVTPAAVAMQVPGVAGILRAAERLLCDTPAARFGGFYIAVIRKTQE
jgi:ubiquinone/menaquinone biosynthesis C-methylase UbiE